MGWILVQWGESILATEEQYVTMIYIALKRVEGLLQKDAHFS